MLLLVVVCAFSLRVVARLVKFPIVKSVAGTDLAIVSDLEKDIYRDIEKTMKRKQISKRDD